ncbi:cytochrome c oxidase subunit 3 [Microvirga sp. TS319]|uniref:cytochrome c oxidase subunit 3 n=1 Tax=Microvirga sp. TS319 TaxID=3241165 RepID=UPI00351A3985
MGSILLFLTALFTIGTWWLLRQGVMSKPWLEQGVLEVAVSEPSQSAEKVGLGVFLAVVGSLFALFISAYAMRMQFPDWRDVPLPKVLWLNTAMLVLSSIALQGARNAARDGDEDRLKIGLLAAGVTALAFVSGQILAWRQLTADGYFLASNSANAFFYVLTGLHGLHVLGGLVALGGTASKAWRGTPGNHLRLSVELCATYWHFLLAVWLVLLSILTGWAGTFLVICRQVLS